MSMQPIHTTALGPALADLEAPSLLRSFAARAGHRSRSRQAIAKREGGTLRDRIGHCCFEATAIFADDVGPIAARFAEGLDQAAAGLRADGLGEE
jgi:hypothetical protein